MSINKGDTKLSCSSNNVKIVLLLLKKTLAYLDLYVIYWYFGSVTINQVFYIKQIQKKI
jgi:hypothetical protein